MIIERSDLRRLRLPFAAAAALIVAGAACLVASEYYLDDARAARNAARQSRIAAQERVSKASEEEREIRENLTYYDQMRRSGMLAEQNRLDLIDSIAKIKSDRKLFEIKYSIEPQKPLDYPGVASGTTSSFVVSEMKLDMLLLHEEDLLDFLTDLQAAGKTKVAVRRCAVTRIAREIPPTPTALQPRLRAECQIDLISLKSVRAG